MRTTVNNVKKSKTYELFCKLLEANFDTNIHLHFAHYYDPVNSFLNISVKNADNRLSELYDIANDFEIVLSKFAIKDNACFMIRRERNFAEFASEKTWDEYYNSAL